MRFSGRACALSVLLALAAAPSRAAEPLAVAANPARSETIVVNVRLNSERKGDFFVERTAAGDFLVKEQDLKAMGFRDPRGTRVLIEGEPYLSLRSVAGISFAFREKELALDVTANPQLLASQQFGVEDLSRNAIRVSPQSRSFFANYAISTARTDSQGSSIGFAGEAGARLGDYLVTSDGATVEDGGRRRFVRLMSAITHDDREALRRVVAGDFFSPTREFSSGVNLGGLSVSKLYGLNPYFIRFPMQSVTGTVALPSELDVFVDGQRVRSERLRPGEFQLRDILAYGGARDVQLVVRDAFGRVEQLNYSFYFSDQPLRQGLHEYSYNAGAIRRSFGLRSNAYGPAAYSVFHRYGFTDGVTLGLRAEGNHDLWNAGPTATLVLGSAGVVSLAASRSQIADRSGAAGLFSYTYQAKRWTAGLSLRRDWSSYAMLADPPLITNRKLEANVSATYQLDQRGTVSLSHSLLSTRGGMTALVPSAGQPYSVSLLQDQRRTTLGYSVPLVSGWAALTATVSHIKDHDKGSRNEGFVGVSIFLEKDYALSANYRGDKYGNSQSAEFSKRQPIGEGLGFTVTADRTADASVHDLRLRSNVQYNAPAAILRAEVERFRDTQGRVADDYRASVAGGLAYVGNTLSFGRPITGSFGVVQVGQLPGVGVSVNGQRIGETGADGRIFVPSLNAYSDNEISLAPESIPIDYSVPAVTRKIAPAPRSGSIVRFAATRLQAFSGKLKTRPADGAAASPVEFARITLAIGAKQENFQTGRCGEFYLENVQPGTYAGTVVVEGKPCRFDLVVPPSNDTFVDLGETVCRREN